MLRQIIDGLKLIESIVATGAYALVAGLLIVDVVGRELFATSFLGFQQIAVYGAIVAGFLGLTLATSDGSHLRPGFMDFIFKDRERFIWRVADVLSAFFFFAAAYIAWTFVIISMNSGDRAPVLYIFVWPLQIVLPYAFASCGIKHLIFAVAPQLRPIADEAPA